MLPSQLERREIHRRMQAAAEHLRLPFRARAWQGQVGNWLGTGIGSSIDFQDHRPYLPGDDPRYIDWQVYGRTGSYTMKLYRAEVSPFVDLVLDVSASMFVEQSKSLRTLELFYFCIESARRFASLRSFAVAGAVTRPLAADEAIAGSDFLEAKSQGPLKLDLIPWRQGSLRVLISDLLFEGSPDTILTGLSTNKGRGLILAPFCEPEANPDWSGNTLFIDCETLRQRNQLVGSDLLARYAQTYQRHFAIWRERARKNLVNMVRVESELDFREALHREALPRGALEFC